jgi:hypothetical protein
MLTVPAAVLQDAVMPVGERDSKAIVLTTDKTLEDMDGPGQALGLALTRSANNCSRRGGVPVAIAAAASSRQLQLTGVNSNSSSVPRKVPLIRLSLCQTLTRPIAGPDSGSPTAAAPAAAASEQASSSQAAAAGGGGAVSKGTGAEAAASTSKAAGQSSAAVAAVASERTAAAAGGSGGGSSSQSAVSKAAIMSFRKVEVLVGAMDLKTDQVGAALRFC